MNDRKKLGLLAFSAIYFIKTLVFSPGYPDAIILLGLVSGFLFLEYKTTEKQFIDLSAKFDKFEKENKEIQSEITAKLKVAEERVNSIKLVSQVNKNGLGIR